MSMLSFTKTVNQLKDSNQLTVLFKIYRDFPQFPSLVFFYFLFSINFLVDMPSTVNFIETCVHETKILRSVFDSEK